MIEREGLYGLDPLPVPIWDKKRGDILTDNSGLEEMVRERLPVSRFLHSRNTALLARLLAKRFGLNEETAWLAGITHDMCKKTSTPLLHGEAAADELEKLGAPPDAVEVVRYHTQGKSGMGGIAKIVFIADKVEMRRKTVRQGLRELCLRPPENISLDELFAIVLGETQEHVRAKGIVLPEESRALLLEAKKAAAAAKAGRAP
jgi:nicotinate-nucleotide adenylyltransferase